MSLIIEVAFTCWLVLLSDGSLFCHCEGETLPEPTPVMEVVDAPRQQLPRVATVRSRD